MKKLIILVIIQSLFLGKIFSQVKDIRLIDTVKLSGVLIYDNKQEKIVLKNFVEINNLATKSEIKRAFRKAEYVFFDPFTLKSIFKRQNQTYEFCVDKNNEKFTIDKENLLFGRYYVLPFKDKFFMNILIDNQKFITLKCL